jgi:hypothetical protein
MNIRQRGIIWGYPGRVGGAVLLCLFFLTFQVVLPAVHAIEEHAAELPKPAETGECAYLVEEVDSGVGANPVLGASRKQHHHDPDSCPICQAILLAHNFCAGNVFAGATAPEPVDLVFPVHSVQYVPGYFSFVRNPRSPPLS